MEDDINEVLATKRAWRKGDEDRRKKDGSAADRKLMADIKRTDRNHKIRIRMIDRETERSVIIVAIGILLAGAILVFWPFKAHADEINLDLIAQIESNSNSDAINGNHIGEYQISPILLEEFNKNTTHNLNKNDLYDSGHSRYIANWYINYKIPQYLYAYKIPDTNVYRIIAWNWGIGHLKKWYRNGHQWNKLPLETRRYIIKYKRGL